MNILVTGGAGFIGSHLVDALLEQGHTVTVLDNLSTGKRERIPEAVRLIKASVEDLQAYINELPEQLDIIYHEAAHVSVPESVKDPLESFNSNVLGTKMLLEMARQKGVKKVIFASSSAVYGMADEFPTTEDSAYRIEHPYGLSKLVNEHYFELYEKLYGIKSVRLRYANVYGPRQADSKETGVISIFCNLAAKKQNLTVFGDGVQSRDFVFVKDVVGANLAALKDGVEGVFNVSTGRSTSINELANMVISLVPEDLQIEYRPSYPGDIARTCLDCTKTSQAFGWNPKYDLIEGLKETLESLM